MEISLLDSSGINWYTTSSNNVQFKTKTRYTQSISRYSSASCQMRKLLLPSRNNNLLLLGSMMLTQIPLIPLFMPMIMISGLLSCIYHWEVHVKNVDGKVPSGWAIWKLDATFLFAVTLVVCGKGRSQRETIEQEEVSNVHSWLNRR